MKTNANGASEHQPIGDMLVADEYNRQRVAPVRDDEYYIHLADLRQFLEKIVHEKHSSILDYGCGGSPYKSLFKFDRYVRADYVSCLGIDLKINDDGRLECNDDQFSLVLTTQVLEHVQDPQAFLREAYRVLVPGGRLVLTTHGIWEDHGCPYDFRRWTADGLRHEIQSAGFEVQEMDKLTTGPRATLFLFARILNSLCVSRRTTFGWAMWLLRRSLFGSNSRRHRWMDVQFAENCVVSDSTPGHISYLALGCIATKPLDSN